MPIPSSSTSSRRERTGGALLPVVAVTALVALVVASLASGTRAGLRAARLSSARAALDAHADRAVGDAVAALRAGAWRDLLAGADRRASSAIADTAITVHVARPAWDRVTMHVVVAAPSGVRGVVARVARRVDVPLDLPWPMPRAPLMGAAPWHVAGVVTGHDDLADTTRRCADGDATATPAHDLHDAPDLAPLLAHPAARTVDPDTLGDTVRGLVVLAPGTHVARPLAVVGWLVASGALEVAAPVTVRGLLVLARAADTRPGGRLDVEGAAWHLGAGGGPAALAAGSRVHWAPCAVRRARDLLARPGPVVTWGRADAG